MTLEHPAAEVREYLAQLSRLMDVPPNRMAIRTVIENLAQAMMRLPACETHLGHLFAKGLYGRKWSCEKGNFLVTETWKVQNISSLIKGKLAIVTEDGYQIMEAPTFFVTEPGTQRMILVLEDAIFTTVHPNPTDRRDTDALVAEMTTVHKFNMAPGSIGVIEEVL